MSAAAGIEVGLVGGRAGDVGPLRAVDARRCARLHAGAAVAPSQASSCDRPTNE